MFAIRTGASKGAYYEGYLCRIDMDEEVWSEELGDPRDIQEYQAEFGETGRGLPPMLDEMIEQELQGFPGFRRDSLLP